MRITPRTPLPATVRTLLWDDKLKGFGVKITPAGSRSFFLDYRSLGRRRQITIGSYPTWSVSSAREEATKLRHTIDIGNDPLGKRQVARDAPTVADLVERYIAEHLPKRRTKTQDDYSDYLKNKILPALGHIKVTAVSRLDVDSLHRSIANRTRYYANRVLAPLSHLFELAIRWGYCTDNPTHFVKKEPEERRERYLTPDELQRLIDTLSTYKY